MKTQELVHLLVNDPLPSKPAAWQLPLAVTVTLALTLAMVVWGWGLHAEWPQLLTSAPFQVKTLWLLALAWSSSVLLWRLARPAQQIGHSLHGLGVALLAMVVLGVVALWQAEPVDRLPLLIGRSWWSCPLSIALIALPWLAVGLLYLRQMAPTRLVWSGACAGFLAGALATALYSLHCSETSYAFFSVWYLAGIGLSTLLGAVLGPRWLRW